MHAQKSKIIIAIGFSVLIVLMVGLALIGFNRMITINKEIENIGKESYEKTKLTYVMRLAARERMISLILMTNLTDPFEKDAEMLRFNRLGTEFANARLKLVSLTLDEDEKALLEQQGKYTAEVRPLQEKLIDYAIVGKTEQAHKILAQKAIPAQNKVIETLKKLHQIEEGTYATRLRQTARTYYETYILFVGILGIGVVTVGIVIAILVIKKISATEDALFLEKERYALAVRGANDGLWDWELETSNVYFSPRWKDMLGYEDHEIENKLDEWIKRIHPDDAEKTMADVTSHLNGHTYYFENEHRLLHKDGTYHWFLARGLARRDETGKANRIAGSLTETTNQKDFENQLQQSERRMRAVLDNVLDGIVTTNEHGEVETFNHAAEQMFGHTEQEIRGHTFKHLLSESSRSEYEKYLSDINTTGKEPTSKNLELMGLRKHGPAFPIEVSISEMWLNKQRKIIFITRDVKQRKSRLSA
jgi:PAS domain S-box-containing protein